MPDGSTFGVPECTRSMNAFQAALSGNFQAGLSASDSNGVRDALPATESSFTGALSTWVSGTSGVGYDTRPRRRPPRSIARPLAYSQNPPPGVRNQLRTFHSLSFPSPI